MGSLSCSILRLRLLFLVPKLPSMTGQEPFYFPRRVFRVSVLVFIADGRFVRDCSHLPSEGPHYETQSSDEAANIISCRRLIQGIKKVIRCTYYLVVVYN